MAQAKVEVSPAIIDFEVALGKFEELQTSTNWTVPFPPERFLSVLSAHVDHSDFPVLLEKAISLITKPGVESSVEQMRQLIADDKRGFNKVGVLFYSYAAKNPHVSLPTNLYDTVEGTINKILNPNGEMDETLTLLCEDIRELVREFREGLNTYHRTNEITEDGENCPWYKMVSKKELAVYRALREAVNDEATSFSKLLGVIKDNIQVIGFTNRIQIFNGLSGVTTEFLGKVRSQGIETSITSIVARCQENKDTAREALLNDLFFNLLNSEQTTLIANAHSEDFFEIMETRRPSILTNILSAEKARLNAQASNVNAEPRIAEGASSDVGSNGDAEAASTDAVPVENTEAANTAAVPIENAEASNTDVVSVENAEAATPETPTINAERNIGAGATDNAHVPSNPVAMPSITTLYSLYKPKGLDFSVITTSEEPHTNNDRPVQAKDISAANKHVFTPAPQGQRNLRSKANAPAPVKKKTLQDLVKEVNVEGQGQASKRQPMRTKAPTQLSRRTKKYQLNDPDLNVGILSVLRKKMIDEIRAVAEGGEKEEKAFVEGEASKGKEIEESNNSDKGRDKGKDKDKGKEVETDEYFYFTDKHHPVPPTRILLFPVGLLTQGDTVKDNFIDHIGTVTKEHPGRLCFGIMNIHALHYVSIFTYQPKVGNMQLIILDPAPKTEENSSVLNHVIERIKERVKDEWEIMKLAIPQQDDDSGCGPSCLEAGEDLITKDLVTIDKDEKMIFHRGRLTLSSENCKNNSEFQSKIREARTKWEDRLSKVTKYYIFRIDDLDEYSGEYSFENNVLLQQAKTEGEELLNTIMGNFFHYKSLEIEKCLQGMEGGLPDDNSDIGRLIDAYIESNSVCEQFMDVVRKIESIGTTNSESVKMHQSTIKETLLYNIQIKNRNERCQLFNLAFINYLKKEIVKGDLLAVPDELEMIYSAYLGSLPVDLEWIGFFQATLSPRWNHFQHSVVNAVKGEVNKNTQPKSKFEINVGNFMFLGSHLKKLQQEKPQVSSDLTTPTRRSSTLMPSTQSANRLPPSVSSTTNPGPKETVVGLSSTFRPSFPRSDVHTIRKSREVKSPDSRHVVNLLQLIAENLRIPYPVQPPVQTSKFNMLSWLKSPDKTHILVDQIIENCNRWAEWLEANQNSPDFEKLRVHIGYYLRSILRNNASSSGENFWQERSYAKIIIGDLAKLMGVEEQFIAEKNTATLFDITIRRTDQQPEETHIKGYDLLMREINIKITESLRNLSLEEIPPDPSLVAQQQNGL